MRRAQATLIVLGLLVGTMANIVVQTMAGWRPLNCVTALTCLGLAIYFYATEIRKT